MPRRSDPLPPHVPKVFRCADAAQLGIDPDRLRCVDLEHPFRGVRRVAEPADETDAPATGAEAPLTRDRAANRAILRRVEAHSLVLPPYAFYVGAAGRAIYGLPQIDPEAATAGDLEVAVFAPHRGLRMKGVQSIQVAPALAHVQTHGGFRVATPASLWALEARRATVVQLVALGDALVCIPRDEQAQHVREAQLATVDQLRAAAAAGPRRAVGALREAIELIRVGCMSVLETDSRLVLVAAGLPEPELDVEVRDARGRLLGISDLAYPEQRVAVEVEGDHHRTTRRQWDRDLEKYAAYAAVGWQVVRLTARHVRGANPAAPRLVREALARAAA